MLARGAWKAPRRRPTRGRERPTRGREWTRSTCCFGKAVARVRSRVAGRHLPVERAKPTRVTRVCSVFFRPEVTGAGSQRKETVVSVHPLPQRPSLVNLRKQAKALLTAWRAGDARALTRVRQFHPRG